jgi:hypothetical protein
MNSQSADETAVASSILIQDCHVRKDCNNAIFSMQPGNSAAHEYYFCVKTDKMIASPRPREGVMENCCAATMINIQL